jgi:hypothetical protein
MSRKSRRSSSSILDKKSAPQGSRHTPAPGSWQYTKPERLFCGHRNSFVVVADDESVVMTAVVVAAAVDTTRLRLPVGEVRVVLQSHDDNSDDNNDNNKNDNNNNNNNNTASTTARSKGGILGLLQLDVGFLLSTSSVQY